MAVQAAFRQIEHEADFCVIGGGMAGLTAAIAAARNGARTVLMHDRPVLGGNASSECRVHIGGADRSNAIPFLRETGILEELRLDNLRRNPQAEFSLWDTVLWEKAHYQEGLTLLLNCSCLSAEMTGSRIASVTGWQLTTQTYHHVRAKIFADCSGDGVLAPLTGADFRIGREARSEYNESIAPEVGDRKTMGMSLCLSARDTGTYQPFEPPAWAYRFEKDEDLPYGGKDTKTWRMGYWWIEVGGEYDSIHDSETLRDELLKIAYGVWDHIKNRGKHGAENWVLQWMQFLPAKRESRRYLGPHVLTQGDIESEGRFDDLVAYGGWSMDDHHPAGFWAVKIGAPATIFHPAPSPYGIPYRTLYSRNVPNLMFAGRTASCTHAAMSSTRVMGTGCSQGQAVGTAAAMAVRMGVDPAGILPKIKELQQQLIRDDCYLPWVKQQFSELTTGARLSACGSTASSPPSGFASSSGHVEKLRDGVNRPVGGDMHCLLWRPCDSVEYRFDRPRRVRQATLVLDSALDQYITLSWHVSRCKLTTPPLVTPKWLTLEAEIDGRWQVAAEVKDNHQRLLRLPVEKEVTALRVTLRSTWGAEQSNLYAFYVD